MRACTAAIRDIKAFNERRKRKERPRSSPKSKTRGTYRGIALPTQKAKVFDAMIDLTASSESPFGAESFMTVFGASTRDKVLESRFEVFMVLAEFSSGISNLAIKELFPITYAEPVDACAAIENAPEVQDAIVLATRGRCTFLEKADNLYLNGAKAVLIVNDRGSGELITMPGGTGSGLPMKIPVAMISIDDGDAIKKALKETPLHGAFK